MIIVQHKCEQSASIGETIMWTGSKWVAGGDYGVGLAYFTFCPYCGLELVEPPDKKIEVSRAELVVFIRMLREYFAPLEGSVKTYGPRAVIDALELLVNGD